MGSVMVNMQLRTSGRGKARPDLCVSWVFPYNWPVLAVTVKET